MTIGEKLKRERKKLDHTLDEVAKKTKIAKMFLIAIENDDLSSLPGGVYTRNFLRAYAKFLNLDEDIITAEYHEQYDVKPHFVVHQEQTKRDDGQFKAQRSRFLLTLFLVLLVLAGIGAVIYYYFPFWEKAENETAQVSTLVTKHPVIRPSNGKKPPAEPEQEKADAGDRQEDVTSDPPDGTGNQTAAYDKYQQPGVGAPGAVGNQPVTSDAIAEPDDQPAEAPENANRERAETPAPSTSSPLPFSSMQAVRNYLAGNGQAASVNLDGNTSLADLFIIEAREEVHLEVYMDGTMATRRLLKAGQVRFYRYGNYNRVIIEDISKVNIQDGQQYFSGAEQEARNVFLQDFEPGEFLIRLGETLNSEL